MADVSVEFGAKDTGLEATLRSVQSDLETLRSEMENTAMSTDEATSALRRMRQLEGIESQLQTMADATRDVGDASVDSAGMVDDATDSMHNVGDAATDAGERSEMGFGQMAAAVATGQLAVEVAMGAIKAAIEGVSAMFDTFGDAIDMGGKLDILSTRTGVASGELARLGRALQNTGMDADMIGPIFDRFNIAIAEASEGTGEAGAALAKLGIPLEQLKGLAPEQQFEVIGKAIQGVSDRSERMNLAIDIFGRGSGTRLLRLFEDYEGTMARVDQQLGIFPRIMNEMSAAFEDAGTEMAAVDDKFVEFASGVISEFMPAIQAIAKGLASIDAAKIGQDLAAMFRSGTEGMSGFQAAIDAIKLGDFKTSFDLIFESIVFQLKDTGNQIYNVLTAAFGTVAQFFRDTFRADGPTFMVLTSAIDYIGNKFSQIFHEAAASIAESMAGLFPKFQDTADFLKEKMQASAFASEAALMRIGATAELAGEDMVRALSESPQVFGELMDRANGKLFDTAENVKRIEALQAQVALKTEEAKNQATDLNTENSKGNDILNSRGTIIDIQKALALSQYQQQIELNNLIAEGNTEEAKAINLKNELIALTEKIANETGLSADKARQLAAEYLISKNNADATTEASKSLADRIEEADDEAKRLRQTVGDIAGKDMERGAKSLRERTKEAREEMKGLESIIGKVGGMSLDDMLEKMGLDPQSFDNTDSKLDALEDNLEALKGMEAADVTPFIDDQGLTKSVDDIKKDLAALEAEENKADATPEISQEDFKKQVDAIVKDLEEAVGKPVTTDLDASESIGEIRKQLAEPIKVKLTPDVDGGAGGAGMSLADVVNVLNKIEQKLPLQALA